jgi:transposase InsO family protein
VTTVAAENLFLRKQLGLYIERKARARRATNAIRFTLAQLSRLFDWRNALTIVKPDTLIRWHRIGRRLFWKYKSRPRGRPRIPAQLRKLIAEMATSNPTWGGERIADKLLLKIGIRISPRTVRRYMPKTPRRPADPTQRWMTFVRNHARAIIACDFFVVVTATFQPVYVFLIMEIHTRRLVHFNVTRHPTADWTLQQFRECVTGDEGYRFVIHDRDSIYSKELDASMKALGPIVLKTPYKSPQANSFCERLIGTARRECLDFMIPLNEAHIRQTLKLWTEHYNLRRPHSSLGPGTPDQKSSKAPLPTEQASRTSIHHQLSSPNVRKAIRCAPLKNKGRRHARGTWAQELSSACRAPKFEAWAHFLLLSRSRVMAAASAFRARCSQVFILPSGMSNNFATSS